MVPPPTIIVFATRWISTPILEKKLRAWEGSAMTLAVSPACSTKEPPGMTTSPRRCTAQTRTSAFTRLPSSVREQLSRMEPCGITNCRSSTLPLAKVSILMAEGKRRSLEISDAAARSGLIVMDRPSSSRMYPISSLYRGFRTLATVLQSPAFLAKRQHSRFSSSESVTAMSRFVSSMPASFSTE